MKRNRACNLTALTSMLMLVVLEGCADAPTQAYSGAALPSDQIAIVKGHAGLGGSDLETVDGKEIDADEATVRPGPHRASVRSFSCTCAAAFVAEAGHTYEIQTICADKRVRIADYREGRAVNTNEVAADCQ